MRILHTSDWHLGHVLHDIDRSAEHAAFLAWLLDQLEAHAVDALVIAGDVFDTANPSAAAQEAYYRFLGEARRRCPALDMVVIAGNHDAPSRIDAPRAVLAPLGMHVVGVLPRADRHTVDVDRLLIPLHDASGAVAAWCVAVPFLRPADLPLVAEGDPLIEGVRAVYAQAIEAARARCAPDQAIVALGHAYLVGGVLSERSERAILGGNQHAIPVGVFPEDVAYVALGHLHKAQRVGGREGVRYCGSPIPLALDERTYRHQVLLVTLEGAACASVEVLPVPRTVDVVRVPEAGAAPVEAVVNALGELPPAEGDPSSWPMLDVHVALDQPEPGLRARVIEALGGRRGRLARLRAHRTGEAGRDTVEVPEDLAALQPVDVFRRCWAASHEGEPPGEVLAAFGSLVDAVAQQEV